MENNFDYQSVPHNYTHCLNDQCVRSSQCLRHLVAQYATPQYISINVINPKCIPDDTAQCPFFKTNHKVRLAWGIKHLLDGVPYKDATSMRRQLISHFGKNAYYRIYRMERGLLPDEQEYIRKQFRDFGITKEPEYQKFTEEYNFG